MDTNIKIKIICSKCAGVINGDTTNSETGEFPCYCGKDIKKPKNNSTVYWRYQRTRLLYRRVGHVNRETDGCREKEDKEIKDTD